MKKSFLFLWISLLCAILQANDRLSFRNFDVKSGISDNYVQSILRDRYGFMCFATLNGLNRYDGYQFKKYTTTQLRAYHNDIESVTEDAAGTIRIKGPVSYYIYDRESQRILLNLLSNAVKYNRKNGTITVTVEKTATPGGEQARIQVADTGIGIKEENKEKVFDRFSQEQHAATTYVGSGIGLHIVKEYITLRQGKIKIEDNHPEGSVFVITLPILKGTTETGPMENIPFAEPEGKRAGSPCEKQEHKHVSILIVEDNTDFRHFLTSCLKDHFQVFDASNGKEALGILSQQSVQMVISDVMMPVTDGLELCRKIKTDIRFSRIPAILLTARTAEEHVSSGLGEGADEYIAPSAITISTLDEQLIEKAIRIVEENRDNSEFSVKELSLQVGISRSRLYKKLMSIAGKSPLEFMRILRLKRGRQLLEKSQLSISQIAYQVGLSPKQFAKYFKEEFGCQPSKYDKKIEIV